MMQIPSPLKISIITRHQQSIRHGEYDRGYSSKRFNCPLMLLEAQILILYLYVKSMFSFIQHTRCYQIINSIATISSSTLGPTTNNPHQVNFFQYGSSNFHIPQKSYPSKDPKLSLYILHITVNRFWKTKVETPVYEKLKSHSLGTVP